MDRVYIPHIQIRSKGAVIFDLPEPPYNHNRHDLTRHETYGGTVTDHAAKRIKRTVDVFLQKSPKRRIFNPVVQAFHDFRLSFITLTISDPRPVPAAAAHDALKVFLQHFRRPPARRSQSEQMTSYLWKAEFQERMQIHYHLTTNVFLHFMDIARVWNGIQKNRGWLDSYYQKTGTYTPNSTDVHAVYKVKDIQAYLAKYLAKTQFRDLSDAGFPRPTYQPTIGGKVWDCSTDLKIPRFACELDDWTNNSLRQAATMGKLEVEKLEHCVYLKGDAVRQLSPQLRADYDNWVTS